MVLHFEVLQSYVAHVQEVRSALASQEASLRQRDALLAEKSANVATLQVLIPTSTQPQPWMPVMTS